MKTRTSKATGAAAAIIAIAASVPLAINAYADPAPTPTPKAAEEIPDLGRTTQRPRDLSVGLERFIN